MKNHELLDMIGDVNEDFVRAADSNVARPRFRWRTLAACAACAVLALGAYPVYRAFNPRLHTYTVVEGDTLSTQEEIKAVADAVSVPGTGATLIGGAYIGDTTGLNELGEEDLGSDIDGESYSEPWQDAPAQEEAIAQYDRLIRNLGAGDADQRLLLAAKGEAADAYPEWFAGAWIDNSYQPEARLAVAIVNGFRTSELEAQITDWCGGEVVFKDAKYSQTYLDGLMDPAVQTLAGTDLSSGIGVNVMENCLSLDLYSSDAIPDRVLAELARLDPDGDAIRVRLFVGSLSAYDETAMKGPAPEPVSTPVAKNEREDPVVEPSMAPGGVTRSAVDELPEPRESSVPAYTENGHKADGLAEYDIIYGDE